MRLAIVIPCYNEEASLPDLIRQLRVSWEIGTDWCEVWFVDDGSTDQTTDILERAQRAYGHIQVIRVDRNRGHQAAILTGLLTAKVCAYDAAITLDADGQHPPSAIPDFIAKYKEGADIVYGVRRRNPSLASRLFYKLMGDSLVPNHGDFRLISARVLDTLTEDSEPFLRGLFSPGASLNQFAQMNLKTAIVEYDEQPRIAGKSTYTLRKRIALFVHALKWRFGS
jgi:glycosyltransferase involved in cell wall biosynthesis